MKHFIKQCTCGKVYSQCRCLDKNKKVFIVKDACEDCKWKRIERGRKKILDVLTGVPDAENRL